MPDNIMQDGKKSTHCIVNSFNEWDPLEEVILGIPDNAQIPGTELSTRIVLFYKEKDIRSVKSGPYPDRIIRETEEDLAEIEAVLKKRGVVVRKPRPIDLTKKFGNPFWNADGFHLYCPRDILLALDDMIIETPGAHRARYFETFAYKDILHEYMRSGARWISAPKPCLNDDTYSAYTGNNLTLNNNEVVFDAANIIKLGYDILYQVSNSGNELGGLWLQNLLSDKFRVHFLHNVYNGTHLDDTIVPLRPGLLLLNPERVNESNLPVILKKWDKIWSPEPVDIGYTGVNICSRWIGMNLLSLGPDLVMVDKNQPELIKILEKNRINVIPLQLRHSRTLAGGFHCVTVDVRRKGSLEKYCD